MTIGPDPPSATDLRVLELLSRREASAEELTPLLEKVFGKEFGKDYRVGIILGVAVRKGALDETVVASAAEAAGCPAQGRTGSGQCRAFRDSFSAAIKSQSSPSVFLEKARRQVLEFAKEQSGGHLGLEEQYAEALASSRHMTPTEILECFVRGDLPSPADPEDEEVLHAMGSDGSKSQPHYSPEFGRTRFREALAGALAATISRSQGEPLVVQHVREIPSDLVAEASELSSKFWPELLGRWVICVVQQWKGVDAAPDQWAAWAELLKCRGW